MVKRHQRKGSNGGAIMDQKSRRKRDAASSSERKGKTALTSSNEPTPEKSMRDLLKEAGFKVLEPRGDGFVIGSGGPIRPKPRSRSGA
jgi:hypothetical protein